MQLDEAVRKINDPDASAMRRTQENLDKLCKPLSSLGKLEAHLVKIAGITGSTRFDFSKKAVAVFCADNGVVAQGISQTGQEVTAIVAENLTTGDTCVCAMSRVAGADVIPVDIGIATDLNAPGLLLRKVMPGTRDLSREPAMCREEAIQALEVGIELALELKDRGYGLAAIGEMGIGNTTTSAAMTAVFLGLPVAEVTGPGAGMPQEGVKRKIRLLEEALALHRPNPDDPLDVLSKVGGLDIAGMAGFCLGGAVCGLPVLLDGVISCVAAVTAYKLAPTVTGYLLPSHVSAEPAGRYLLEHLGLDPLLHAGMRLGEGSGAVACFPLYDMIDAVYDQMVSFGDEGMEPYEKFTD